MNLSFDPTAQPAEGAIALIPARGGSKRLPRKNLLPLAGKPMIAWTIAAAVAARSITRVVVSTDDEELAAVAIEWGAEVPFLRPAHLATDTASSGDVVLHAASFLGLGARDAVVLLQPTSPLRITEDIDGAWALFCGSGRDSVVSVSPAPHAMNWLCSIGDNGTVVEVPLRSDVPLFALNGAIYVTTVGVVEATGSFKVPGRTRAYVMPPERSIDIDEPWQFAMAEKFLESRV